MADKIDCQKIKGRYYMWEDIEKVFKTRINCVLPDDLTEEETTEAVEARINVKNKK